MDNAAQSSMSASPVDYGTTLDRRPRTCWTVVSSNFTNRWLASLAMSTDGSFPSRPRQFLNMNLIVGPYV